MEVRTALLALLLLAVGFVAGRWTASVPPADGPAPASVSGPAAIVKEPPTLKGTESAVAAKDQLVPAAPLTAEGTAASEHTPEAVAVRALARPIREAVESTRLEELRFLALRQLDAWIAELTAGYESIRNSPPNVSADYVRDASAEALSQQREVRDWRRRILEAKTIETFLREANEAPESYEMDLLARVYGR